MTNDRAVQTNEPNVKKTAGKQLDWFVSVSAVIVAVGACWLIWLAGGGSWFEPDLLNVIGYVGGVISLAGVLIAFLIFRQQKRESAQTDDFQRQAGQSQTKVLENLREILHRVERKIDQNLTDASAQISDLDAEQGTGAADLWEKVLPDADEDTDARYLVSPDSGKRRRVYLPDSIPLAVIGALVKVWDEAELTGKWALGTLRGAFRAEGKGNHPWYLVFVPPGDPSGPRVWKVTRGPGGTDHAVQITDGREFA